MRYFLAFGMLAILIFSSVNTKNAFASCAVNEDWTDAPCLDLIRNGRYVQEDIDRWAEYYSFKGSQFMEAQYYEMNNAIKEDRLEQWASESIKNRNVYEYYFFSGRAPNTGEYRGQFDIIKINESGAPESGKEIYENIAPWRLPDYGFIMIVMFGMIVGISAGIIFLVRRKRK